MPRTPETPQSCTDGILSHVRRRKDDVAGEVPVAFVVRAAGSTISEEEVKDYIAKQVTSSNCQSSLLVHTHQFLL